MESIIRRRRPRIGRSARRHDRRFPQPGIRSGAESDRLVRACKTRKPGARSLARGGSVRAVSSTAASIYSASHRRRPRPRQFVKDSDPVAYEKLVDRLMSNPHFGSGGAATGSTCA